MFVKKGVKSIGIVWGDNFREDGIVGGKSVWGRRSRENRRENIDEGFVNPIVPAWRGHVGKSMRKRGGTCHRKRNRCRGACPEGGWYKRKW